MLQKEQVINMYSSLIAILRSSSSRSRNLAAKRMLHASAEAMAEILGIAVTPSPSASGYSTPILTATSSSSQIAPTFVASATQLPPTTATDSTDKEAEKLAKKTEKKAAKALKTQVQSQTESSETTGKELKKKRKRDA
jgi:hypothetical protein